MTELGACWPSAATIARKANISSWSVRPVIAGLEADGHVVVQVADHRSPWCGPGHLHARLPHRHTKALSALQAGRRDGTTETMFIRRWHVTAEPGREVFPPFDRIPAPPPRAPAQGNGKQLCRRQAELVEERTVTLSCGIH